MSRYCSVQLQDGTVDNPIAFDRDASGMDEEIQKLIDAVNAIDKQISERIEHNDTTASRVNMVSTCLYIMIL